jgi:hypothetical protein
MISKDDFTNLTILTYDRGMMGEFFALLLYLREYKSFTYDDLFNKLKNKDSYSFKSWELDKTFNCIVDNDMLFINSPIMGFMKDIFKENVYNIILNKKYGDAKSAFLKMINLHVTLQGDHTILTNKNMRDKIINLLTDDAVDTHSTIITRSHNYNQIDFTECFKGCEHINFYADEYERNIFIALYFYKKIPFMFGNYDNKTRYWDIDKRDLNTPFEFVYSRGSSKIENACNINVFDILSGKLYPERFIVDDDAILKINDNNRKNIEILNSMGIDINDRLTKQQLYSKIKVIFDKQYEKNN